MGNPNYITGDSFDEIYKKLLWWLSYEPQYVCSPRGQKIKENLAVTLELKNPRARLLSCKKRNTNYGFAVGEFLWYWNGRQDLETMLYYNKRMKDYSTDGRTLNSAYGHRLRKENIFAGHDRPINGTGGTQWETCVKTLVSDSDSRRAVMIINSPADEREAVVFGSKDVPCTLSLQFFVRENKLDLHVHMRSNDVMWGLTYDLFSFTLFQECMLMELRKNDKFKNLNLGKYYHTAGSLHLYENHFSQAEQIVHEYKTITDLQPIQDPLSDLGDLEIVSEMEEFLRVGEGNRVPTTGLKIVSPTAHWMIRQLEEHRKKRDDESREKKG